MANTYSSRRRSIAASAHGARDRKRQTAGHVCVQCVHNTQCDDVNRMITVSLCALLCQPFCRLNWTSAAPQLHGQYCHFYLPKFAHSIHRVRKKSSHGLLCITSTKCRRSFVIFLPRTVLRTHFTKKIKKMLPNIITSIRT